MIASKAGWTRKKPRAHYIGVIAQHDYLPFKSDRNGIPCGNERYSYMSLVSFTLPIIISLLNETLRLDSFFILWI